MGTQRLADSLNNHTSEWLAQSPETRRALCIQAEPKHINGLVYPNDVEACVETGWWTAGTPVPESES